MCSKIKQLLGKKAVRKRESRDNIAISLQGEIGEGSFQVAAKIEAQEKMSESLTLDGYELIIKVSGMEGSIFIGVQLHLKTAENDPLTIQGLYRFFLYEIKR